MHYYAPVVSCRYYSTSVTVPLMVWQFSFIASKPNTGMDMKQSSQRLQSFLDGFYGYSVWYSATACDVT